MRHAGVGFPNGAVDNATVFALPSPDLLMLVTEARWHHDAATQAGKFVLWRAIPRRDARPAKLGWSPSRFVREVLYETETAKQPIRDFIAWNELDLQDERGDGEDDWSHLDNRYKLLGAWAHSVIHGLRDALPGTRLHWGAWTPDHHALEHLNFWKYAADSCDVVDFHAYESLANIQREYLAYRRAFPDKPLALTEWHCKGDLQEEERVLRWLAETMQADPLFEAAYFFIWRWDDAPGWWSDDWDIEHRPERLELFMNPPTAGETPMAEPSIEEYQAFARPKIEAGGYDWETFRKQIQQESGWRHYDHRGNVLTSYTGSSKGISQLNQNFYNPDLWRDPWTNLQTGIDLARGYLKRFGSHRKALAAYNWGPSNVAGYKKADGTVVPPWDGRRETISAQGRHYLDVILGPEWNEPGAAPPPAPEASMYNVGPGIAAKMAEHNDEPATDEHVGGITPEGNVQYAYAFGKSGAYYVYLVETNENHRFQPD